MATITIKIKGQPVQVDERFDSLSPEEQQRTVNEIAAQMGIGAEPAATGATGAPVPSLADSIDPPEGAKPGSRAYADWALARARAGKKLPQVGAPPPEDFTRDMGSKALAAIGAGFEAIPIAGPTIYEGLTNMRAAIQGMTPEQVIREQEILREANPISTVAGQVTGTVAPYLLASTIPVVNTLLGVNIGAPMALNVAAGAASGKIISDLDTLARGGDPEEVIPGLNMKPGDVAGAAGAAGPIVGKVVGAGLSKLGEVVVDPAMNALRVAAGRGDAAARATLEKAVRADIQAGTILSPADEAAAVAAGQPLLNVDRLGGSTRQLARTAAATDPVAREQLSEFVNDRFLSQNARAKEWIERNTNAPTDIYAVQQSLNSAKKSANYAAYNQTAYLAPGADNIWTPELAQLMQSDNVRSAIRSALRTSNEEAALSGSKPIKSPFKLKKKGGYELRPGTQPSLEFWDHVQRALRRRAGELARNPESGFDVGQVQRARAQLNAVLDNAVPEFAAARGGAAAWFGAEDALEAGQKFATAEISDMGAARAAHAKFSPAEKKLFASGLASAVLNKIGRVPDTADVINGVFRSPQAREVLEMGLGKRAAKELEHFVRVENAMKLTKQAIQGISNPVQQLLALGIRTGTSAGSVGYGTGAAFGGLDPRNWGSKAWTMAAMGAAGRAGAKAIGKRVDASVMNRVIKILASEDPKLIQQVVQNASRSDRSAAALQAIETGLSILVRNLGPDGAPAAEETPE